MDNYRRWLKAQWDRAAAVAAVAVGAVALALGWWGMSGSGFPAQQLPYIISGGMVGLFAVGVGATLWLSADLRDEWRKLDRIEAKMDGIADALARSANDGGPPADGPEPQTTGATVGGRRRR